VTDTTLNDLTQWTGTSWTPWTAESPWEQTDPRFHIDPGGRFWDRTGRVMWTMRQQDKQIDRRRQTHRQRQTDKPVDDVI